MAITITDHGEFQSATGAITTAINTAGSTSATAGSTLVLLITANCQRQNNAGTSDITFVITDNIGDSNGTAWSNLDGNGVAMVCTRGAVLGNTFMEKSEIWVRTVGTGPGTSKTVTVTGSAAAGSETTTLDGWIWADLVGVTGQHSTPKGASTGATSRQAAGPTSFACTLSGAPASTAVILSVIHGDNTVPPTLATKPSGWTDLQSEAPAWGAASNTADINGSGITTFSWTGLVTASNYLASAIEIIAAAAPTTITIVRAVAETTAASLVWNVPTDGGSAITDYLIEYNPAGAGWSTFSHTASTNAYAFVTGLTAGVSYTFRISAINSAGTGTASSASEAAVVLASHNIAHILSPLDGGSTGLLRLGSLASARADFRQLSPFLWAGTNDSVGTQWDTTAASIEDDYLWGPADLAVAAGLISIAAGMFTPGISTTAGIDALLNAAAVANFLPAVTTATITSITAGLNSASAANFTPTVSALVSLTATLLSTAIALFSPALTTSVGVAASLVPTSVARFTPSISATSSITAPLISALVSRFLASLSSSATIAASLVSASVSKGAPTLSALTNITAALEQASVSMATPTTTASASISAPLVAALVNEFTVVLTSAASIAASLNSASVSTFTPTMSATAGIDPGLLSSAVALFSASVSSSTSESITASLVSALTVLDIPTVSVASNASITATLITAAVTNLLASMTTEANITAATRALGVTQGTPSIASPSNVVAPIISILMASPSPALTDAVLVVAPLVTGLISLVSPLLNASTDITLDVININGTLFSITVTSTGVRLAYWDGLVWVKLPLKSWDGAAWVQDQRIKIYDPTAQVWIRINGG